MDVSKMSKFNQDQRDHEIIIQKMTLDFCHKIMTSALEHDRTKWSEVEYETFVASRDSLRGSVNGQDEAYQANLKKEAIQHHIHNNPHHPQYWDERGLPMPVHEVISMYFDWQSRCLAKGGTMDDFWEFNISKLSNQLHAVSIVEALKREYAPLLDDMRKKYGQFESMEFTPTTAMKPAGV